MRITGQDTVNTISKSQNDSAFELSKTAAGSRTAQSASPSTDAIELGGQNGLLSQAQNAGTGDSASRIEQLRALVQSGQYEVDAGALSQSIVSATMNGY